MAKLIRSIVDFESSNGAGLKSDFPSLKESPNIKGYIEEKEDIDAQTFLGETVKSVLEYLIPPDL